MWNPNPNKVPRMSCVVRISQLIPLALSILQPVTKTK